jgi:phosphohistidine phosphatase
MLWILRHAQAADPAPGEPDAARRLTPHGRRQAQAVGAGLAALGVKLDACLTSPRVRARETAELVCTPLGVAIHELAELGGGPFDPEAVAAGFGEEVLLVGHNPDIAQAIHALTGARVKMRTAALAVIEHAELQALLLSSQLALLLAANVPDPGSAGT